MLGICRGAQLLNIAYGGTLYQHLPDQVGHDGHRPAAGEFADTTVTRQPRQRAARAAILGADVDGHACHHHQAIDKLGAGLTVATGWRGPMTVSIEAVDLLAGPPVRASACSGTSEQDGGDLRLFEALVEAAQRPKPGGRPEVRLLRRAETSRSKPDWSHDR